ncbi:MAG: hypothetical protein FGF52_02760 [Candidatus Brockarchaeota archaeon]|nr:hypothetical protein [Candidatus Brockarchaeota archaeon]
MALTAADNIKGASKDEIKRASRVSEKELQELIKKGYLETIKTRGRIVKYRTTESGREYCAREAKNLKLLKYLKAKQVSNTVFLNALKSAYMNLVRTSPIAPYVKVSDLRARLKVELGIEDNEFDKRIIELNSSNPYDIQLHIGSGEPHEGVKTARGVYHYVIIK